MFSRITLLITILLFAGCATRSSEEGVLGEAYVGPASLNLRADIPSNSPVTATVAHGERLQILQRRRVFLKVRTAKGVEGWTSERFLLSSSEVQALKAMAEEARHLASQGVASTFSVLNMHTLPSRSAPSFAQIQEGQKIDVLMYRVAPRTSPPRPPLLPSPAAPVRKVARKPAPEKFPPLPPAPKPPRDWLEISRRASEATPASQPEDREPSVSAPVPADDWALVRTRQGQVGWVLTSRLYMSIPDEVAQYAEGHRITSYFSLGELRDGDQIKHHWLWTTLSQTAQPYDFDSFRVFIWNLRRHRYETAYIQRRVKGYLPVKLHPVQLAVSDLRRGAPPEAYPGFSVCVEKADGRRYWQNFAFIYPNVRFAGEQSGESIFPGAPAQPPQEVAGNPPPAARKSVYGRVKSLLVAARRWLGGQKK